MEYHILAVGDVVMEPGLRHLERHLRPLKKLKNIPLPWSTVKTPPAWD